jgi:hypothetical protein
MTAKSITNIIKEYSEQNDFGFTTSNTKEVVDKHNLAIDDYKEKIKKIEELIMPLLANLHASAEDGDTIYWPNRKVQLEEKIKEFLSLTR